MSKRLRFKHKQRLCYFDRRRGPNVKGDTTSCRLITAMFGRLHVVLTRSSSHALSNLHNGYTVQYKHVTHLTYAFVSLRANYSRQFLSYYVHKSHFKNLLCLQILCTICSARLLQTEMN